MAIIENTANTAQMIQQRDCKYVFFQMMYSYYLAP